VGRQVDETVSVTMTNCHPYPCHLTSLTASSSQMPCVHQGGCTCPHILHDMSVCGPGRQGAWANELDICEVASGCETADGGQDGWASGNGQCTACKWLHVTGQSGWDAGETGGMHEATRLSHVATHSLMALHVCQPRLQTHPMHTWTPPSQPPHVTSNQCHISVDTKGPCA